MAARFSLKRLNLSPENFLSQLHVVDVKDRHIVLIFRHQVLFKLDSNCQMMKELVDTFGVNFTAEHALVVCHDGPMTGVNGKQTSCNICDRHAAFLADDNRQKIKEQVKKFGRSLRLGGFLQQCFHFFIHWWLFQGRELAPNNSFEMLKTKHEIGSEIGH